MSLARRYAPSLIGLALLGIALTLGLLAVRGVAWPPLYDALRDVGTAQVLLDGRYPADNMYPREVWWFNPLMGALIALGSFLTGWAAPMASVQLGPWLNLIPALLFWLLASRWLGRWGGVAALGGYLLWNAHSPSVVFATYTPWLFASHFAQGLFCASLLAWCWARQQRKAWAFVFAGGLHGLTFIAHTGPALLLGVIFCLVTALDALRPVSRDVARRDPLRRLLTTLATAFVVSLPYTGPILLRYQMRVVNIFPTINVESPMRLAELGDVAMGTLHLVNAIALVGLGYMLRTLKNEKRRLLLAWLIAIAAWLVQGYAWQYFGLTQRGVLQIVPVHHAHTAATLLRALCFGAGVLALAAFAASRIPTRLNYRPAAVPAVVAMSVLLGIPGYRHFRDFTPAYIQQTPYASVSDSRSEAYEWIRAHIPPEASVLSDDWLGILVTGPAARGSVATLLIFSNPYTDAVHRHGDRDRMFDAIRAKDEATFLQLAERYAVRGILATGVEERIVRAAGFASITEAKRAPPLTVFEVTYPASAMTGPHGSQDHPD